MSRYDRQAVLPELGPGGQARIEAASVLVIGAGGLGAPVLQYLAGAGVGRLRIVDPDRVALSNLHRQTLFREADIGAGKADRAARAMRELNADCTVEPVCARFDPMSAPELMEGCDIVLDCADSFAASYLASDLCFEANLPLISASALGLEGYCGGFCGGAPSLRAVFPELPARAGTCALSGVMGPVVGLAGAVQAQMALAVIAGIGPSPLGRLVIYDAATWRFGGFRFDGAPEPAFAPRFVAPAQIAEGDAIYDLRGADEAPLIHPAARRVPPDAFGPGGILPPRDARTVLCCRSGLRAFAAAERLASAWEGNIVLLAAGEPIEGETT